ncbi:MAG: hypothetical protein ACF8MF_08260 [Phycisphaerales bacterium JB052]
MTTAHEHAVAPEHKPSNPIVWGAYLACSWTWCIGMFLPVLLLRDFGWLGFLVFAVPNVIGAAAMGWVLKSRGESETFVLKHAKAVWCFSAVTLAFHVFWVLWIFQYLRMGLYMSQNASYGVLAAFIAFWLVTKRSSYFKRMPQLATALWIFSALVLVATFVTPDLGPINQRFHKAHPSNAMGLFLLPISTFGFLLCPYLDVTFHHARQQLGNKQRGRIGFTVGFMVMFALMIVLTTRYAPMINDALNGQRANPTQTTWIGAVLLAHILFQWVFTVQVHLDRVKAMPIKSVPPYNMLIGVALLAGLIGFFATNLPSIAGLSGGEIVYRCFIGAYGLVFPTYVLYRAVLARNGARPMSMVAVWGAIVLATPMFWLGFMQGESVWLAPGMGIVLMIAAIGIVNRKQGVTGSIAGQ